MNTPQPEKGAPTSTPPTFTGEARFAGDAHWTVNIFPVRIHRGHRLLSRSKTSTGYGWAASGNPAGYHFDKGPYRTWEDAAQAAHQQLAAEGKVVKIVLPQGRTAAQLPGDRPIF